MADTKITGLTANTAPILTDIMPMVDDPGGSAATQKITIQNLRRQLFPYSVCGGRLTLTTGTPVTTADVTAAGTLYFTPYSKAFGCGQVGLYDGSAGWDVLNFTELSLNIGAYTASKPYDIWIYNNSGTAALDSTVWTDATTRATALAVQDGVYVKTGATTRRYLGTIYINSSGGQTDSSLTKRNVWNYYNRVPRQFYLTEATAHNYTTAAWQYWNNTNTNIIEYTCGVVEDTMQLSIFDTLINITSGTAGIFLGLDIDAATANEVTYPSVGTSAVNASVRFGSTAHIAPVLGRHFIAVIEYGGANAVQTRYRLSGAILG